VVDVRESDNAAVPIDRCEALFRSCYQAIFAYVLRRTASDLEVVSDLVAEVFVIALRKQDRIPEPPADRLWLYGVARHVVLDHQRRRARRRRLESRLREAAVINAAADVGDPARMRVLAAMDSLRPADRESLQLVVWDGLSHAEAARVLGCSANAVAVRIHKAKARLREALAPDMPDARNRSADIARLSVTKSRSRT
jgi:RNA polymerase sigma-70 factor (ECF subfamily)